MWNGLPGNISMRSPTAIENRRSTTLRWLPAVIKPSPCGQTSKMAWVYAGLLIWRATQQRKSSSRFSSVICVVLVLNTVLSAQFGLATGSIEMMTNRLECNCTTFRSLGKIPCIHILISEISSNTSTARWSTIPIEDCTHTYPMWMNRGTIHLTLTNLRLTVRSFGKLIDFMDSLYLGGRKYLSTKFCTTHVSRKLVPVNRELDHILTKTLTRYIGFWKNDTMSREPSSYCILMA